MLNDVKCKHDINKYSLIDKRLWIIHIFYLCQIEDLHSKHSLEQGLNTESRKFSVKYGLKQPLFECLRELTRSEHLRTSNVPRIAAPSSCMPAYKGTLHIPLVWQVLIY